ncbi:hypothetical protein R6Q59_015546 [Mikania micrantha]
MFVFNHDSIGYEYTTLKLKDEAPLLHSEQPLRPQLHLLLRLDPLRLDPLRPSDSSSDKLQYDACFFHIMQLLENPLYIGLRLPRLEGEEYVSVVDELMEPLHACCRWPKSSLKFKWAFQTLDRYPGLLGTVRTQGQPCSSCAVNGKPCHVNKANNMYLFAGSGEACLCRPYWGVPLVGLRDIGFVARQAVLKAELGKIAENQHAFISFAFVTFGSLAPVLLHF